ncbi:FCD domain-containing protein (plasmid) [Streptomyces sp. GDS52]|uniref:FCD domain-containing protein n=1 Tax=Streptomyces sp. GDS52 TaxID=3406419 RepID=UPI003FCF181C
MTGIDAMHTWRELSRRLRVANETLEPVLRTVGIGSAADFEVLELLTRSPGGELPQRKVHEAVGLSQSGSSRLVTRLERSGLLRRTASEIDARAALLKITESGRDLVAKHRDAYEQHVRHELTVLSNDLPFLRDAGDPKRHPDPTEPARAAQEAVGEGPANEAVSDGGLLQFGESLLSLASGAITVADAIHVRDALEPLVLIEAAQYRTEQDIVDCEQILATMAGLLGDGKAFYFADWSLHHRLAAVCRNKLLRQIYESLLFTLEQHVDTVVPTDGLRDYLRRRLVVHTEIIDAVASGKADRVREAAHSHAITGIAAHVAVSD